MTGNSVKQQERTTDLPGVEETSAQIQSSPRESIQGVKVEEEDNTPETKSGNNQTPIQAHGSLAEKSSRSTIARMVKSEATTQTGKAVDETKRVILANESRAKKKPLCAGRGHGMKRGKAKPQQRVTAIKSVQSRSDLDPKDSGVFIDKFGDVMCLPADRSERTLISKSTQGGDEKKFHHDGQNSSDDATFTLQAMQAAKIITFDLSQQESGDAELQEELREEEECKAVAQEEGEVRDAICQPQEIALPANRRRPIDDKGLTSKLKLKSEIPPLKKKTHEQPTTKQSHGDDAKMKKKQTRMLFCPPGSGSREPVTLRYEASRKKLQDNIDNKAKADVFIDKFDDVACLGSDGRRWRDPSTPSLGKNTIQLNGGNVKQDQSIKAKKDLISGDNSSEFNTVEMQSSEQKEISSTLHRPKALEMKERKERVDNVMFEPEEWLGECGDTEWTLVNDRQVSTSQRDIIRPNRQGYRCPNYDSHQTEEAFSPKDRRANQTPDSKCSSDNDPDPGLNVDGDVHVPSTSLSFHDTISWFWGDPGTAMKTRGARQSDKQTKKSSMDKRGVFIDSKKTKETSAKNITFDGECESGGRNAITVCDSPQKSGSQRKSILARSNNVDQEESIQKASTSHHSNQSPSYSVKFQLDEKSCHEAKTKPIRTGTCVLGKRQPACRSLSSPHSKTISQTASRKLPSSAKHKSRIPVSMPSQVSSKQPERSKRSQGLSTQRREHEGISRSAKRRAMFPNILGDDKYTNLDLTQVSDKHSKFYQELSQNTTQESKPKSTQISFELSLPSKSVINKNRNEEKKTQGLNTSTMGMCKPKPPLSPPYLANPVIRTKPSVSMANGQPPKDSYCKMPPTRKVHMKSPAVYTGKKQSQRDTSHNLLLISSPKSESEHTRSRIPQQKNDIPKSKVATRIPQEQSPNSKSKTLCPTTPSQQDMSSNTKTYCTTAMHNRNKSEQKSSVSATDENQETLKTLREKTDGFIWSDLSGAVTESTLSGVDLPHHKCQRSSKHYARKANLNDPQPHRERSISKIQQKHDFCRDQFQTSPPLAQKLSGTESSKAFSSVSRSSLKRKKNEHIASVKWEEPVLRHREHINSQLILKALEKDRGFETKGNVVNTGDNWNTRKDGHKTIPGKTFKPLEIHTEKNNSEYVENERTRHGKKREHSTCPQHGSNAQTLSRDRKEKIPEMTTRGKRVNRQHEVEKSDTPESSPDTNNGREGDKQRFKGSAHERKQIRNSENRRKRTATQRKRLKLNSSQLIKRNAEIRQRYTFKGFQPKSKGQLSDGLSSQVACVTNTQNTDDETRQVSNVSTTWDSESQNNGSSQMPFWTEQSQAKSNSSLSLFLNNLACLTDLKPEEEEQLCLPNALPALIDTSTEDVCHGLQYVTEEFSRHENASGDQGRINDMTANSNGKIIDTTIQPELSDAVNGLRMKSIQRDNLISPAGCEIKHRDARADRSAEKSQENVKTDKTIRIALNMETQQMSGPGFETPDFGLVFSDKGKLEEWINKNINTENSPNLAKTDEDGGPGGSVIIQEAKSNNGEERTRVSGHHIKSNLEETETSLLIDDETVTYSPSNPHHQEIMKSKPDGQSSLAKHEGNQCRDDENKEQFDSVRVDTSPMAGVKTIIDAFSKQALEGSSKWNYFQTRKDVGHCKQQFRRGGSYSEYLNATTSIPNSEVTPRSICSQTMCLKSATSEDNKRNDERDTKIMRRENSSDTHYSDDCTTQTFELWSSSHQHFIRRQREKEKDKVHNSPRLPNFENDKILDLTQRLKQLKGSRAVEERKKWFVEKLLAFRDKEPISRHHHRLVEQSLFPDQFQQQTSESRNSVNSTFTKELHAHSDPVNKPKSGVTMLQSSASSSNRACSLRTDQSSAIPTEAFNLQIEMMKNNNKNPISLTTFGTKFSDRQCVMDSETERTWRTTDTESQCRASSPSGLDNTSNDISSKELGSSLSPRQVNETNARSLFSNEFCPTGVSVACNQKLLCSDLVDWYRPRPHGTGVGGGRDGGDGGGVGARDDIENRGEDEAVSGAEDGREGAEYGAENGEGRGGEYGAEYGEEGSQFDENDADDFDARSVVVSSDRLFEIDSSWCGEMATPYLGVPNSFTEESADASAGCLLVCHPGANCWISERDSSQASSAAAGGGLTPWRTLQRKLNVAKKQSSSTSVDLSSQNGEDFDMKDEESFCKCSSDLETLATFDSFLRFQNSTAATGDENFSDKVSTSAVTINNTLQDAHSYCKYISGKSLRAKPTNTRAMIYSTNSPHRSSRNTRHISLQKSFFPLTFQRIKGRKRNRRRFAKVLKDHQNRRTSAYRSTSSYSNSSEHGTGTKWHAETSMSGTVGRNEYSTDIDISEIVGCRNCACHSSPHSLMISSEMSSF